MAMTLDLATLAPDTLALVAGLSRKRAEEPLAEAAGSAAFFETLAEVMEREAGLRALGRTMGAHPAVGEALEHVIRELPPAGLVQAMGYVRALRDAEAGAAAFYQGMELPALAESRTAAAEFAQALLLALDDERKRRIAEAFRRALERMAEADEEGTDGD